MRRIFIFISSSRFSKGFSVLPQITARYIQRRDFRAYSAMSVKPDKTPINLLRGWPNPALLPRSALKAAADVALTDPEVVVPGLLYGPDDGYLPLRKETAKWLASVYDAPDDYERICITGGASQNLACILQVFTDPSVTKNVWMVAPCYFLACRIFEDAGFAGRLRAIPEDAEGLDISFLTKGLEEAAGKQMSGAALKPNRPWSKTYDHIIYAVPNFSNPSGKTMTLRRRQQLVELARTHNALIITDDVYDCLQWPVSAPPANAPTTAGIHPILPRLTDIDRSLPSHAADPRHFGHTVSNGSFSKILGPGLRTGWADATPTFSYGLSQCGSSRSGGCPSQLQATIIAEMIRSGKLQGHIRDVLIPAYASRWRKTVEALEEHLVPLGVKVSNASPSGTDVAGGYFVWLELPEGMSAERVSAAAKVDENLIVAHGDLFEVYGDEKSVTFPRSLRICFAWEDEGNLVEGIQRLASAISSVRDKGDVGRSSDKLGDSRLPAGEY
jgi:DNA-binding transcriptional MocR family regulator